MYLILYVPTDWTFPLRCHSPIAYGWITRFVVLCCADALGCKHLAKKSRFEKYSDFWYIYENMSVPSRGWQEVREFSKPQLRNKGTLVHQCKTQEVQSAYLQHLLPVICEGPVQNYTVKIM